MTQKVSIRFYKDSKVRGVWDDEQNKWFFSVLDIIADEEIGTVKVCRRD